VRGWLWYDSAAFSQLRGVILDLSGNQKKLGAVFVTALIASLTVFLQWFTGATIPPPAEEVAPIPEEAPAEEVAPEEVAPEEVAPIPEEAPAEEVAPDVE